MNTIPADIATLRRQLLWRATHRGIKEMDIVIGGFATANISQMPLPELRLFAELLELPDQDYLAWLTGQAEVPHHLRSDLLDRMLGYRPIQ
jgi:antitoxin CptB